MTKFLKGSHLAGVASAALTLVAFQPAFAQSGPADDPQSVTTSGNANRTVTDASDVVVINGIAYRDRTADTAPVLVYDTDYFKRFEPLTVGDLVICASVVAEEAVAQRKSVEAHHAHLVVHGMLHLQGYEHETSAADAEIMEEKEREILAGLGYPDPYR